LATAYWFAAFPALARNTPIVREHAEKYKTGEISRNEYDAVDSTQRNEICNMGLYISGMAEIPLVVIGIGILYSVHANATTVDNNWGLSVLIAWSSVFFLVLAIPWFVLEKRRPGQPLPPDKSILTAGLWQVSCAASHIWKLKQSLAYLFCFSLLGDSLNTTVTMVNTIQSAVAAYNTIYLCNLLIVGLVGQTVGIYIYMQVQRRWRLGTKTMFNVVCVSIIALDVYGLAGVWTQALGFHHVWEFWLYQAWLGIMVCPWYSYSQTMVHPPFFHFLSPLPFPSPLPLLTCPPPIFSRSPLLREKK
jgi:MFS-type transporter involved in bile tolerance (Atg22 family)